MSYVTSAKAYANNEIVLIAWQVDDRIPECLGFEITRIPLDGSEPRVLPAWVPFKGQRNPEWKPQTTSIWPVQKLMWQDFTIRKQRDQVTRRPADVHVKYRIRPLARLKAPSTLKPVTDIPAKTYEGDPVPLAYIDEGLETNVIDVTTQLGDVRAAFTNGILSAQWLKHALQELGQDISPKTILAHMSDENDKFRKYFSGDVPVLLSELLERAEKEEGAYVRLALYELSDPQLTKLLLAHKNRVRLILANSSKGRDSGEFDETNKLSRSALQPELRANMWNRMFNNNHIGHNKFAVYMGAGDVPRAVMTGSTNWTPTGLCGQSNNAVIIESDALARQYSDYWERIRDDTGSFSVPDPLSAPTRNVQGPSLRAENMTALSSVKLGDGTIVTMWRAPNTRATTKKSVVPPDLEVVFSRMRQAQDVMLFAAFYPAMSGKNSIIEEAINIGKDKPTLIVYGSVSDPQAMPNYVPPPKGSPKGTKAAQPGVYDSGNTHIVRAAALGEDDVVGDFEKELLKVGNAIIHDKIVVVDPLSDAGFVVLGSHNLGFKASYENDENLLIIEKNRKLLEAYATHLMDLYDHYRFRAVQEQRQLEEKESSRWDGFLSVDGTWLADWKKPAKGKIAKYFGA